MSKPISSLHKEFLSLGPIGPSTGWLAAKISPHLNAHNEVLRLCNASAAEIVWGDESRQHALSQAMLAADLTYSPLHLGSFSDFRAILTPAQEEEIKFIREVYERNSLHATSCHPDVMPFGLYDTFRSEGIMIGIENLDRSKTVARDVEDIEFLMASTGFPAVLDLQHAYEIAKDSHEDYETLVHRLATAMLRHAGITHLHLSGEISENGVQLLSHAQVHEATNQEVILRGLRLVLSLVPHGLPIILEGDPLQHIAALDHGHILSFEDQRARIALAADSIATEIAFIREFVNSLNQPRSVESDHTRPVNQLHLEP